MSKGERNRTFRKVKRGLMYNGVKAGRSAKRDFDRSWSQDPRFRKYMKSLIVVKETLDDENQL